MNDLISESMKRERFAMTWLGVLAALALTLAGVGIYSVISHITGRRTREIGIRLALGAQKVDILKLVLKTGLTFVLIGIALGLAGSLVLTRLIGSLLFDVKPIDVTTFSVVSGVMSMVALAASYLPARHATRVDPLVALHFE
jgi:putative ABC transport system permease protein